MSTEAPKRCRSPQDGKGERTDGSKPRRVRFARRPRGRRPFRHFRSTTAEICGIRLAACMALRALVRTELLLPHPAARRERDAQLGGEPVGDGGVPLRLGGTPRSQAPPKRLPRRPSGRYDRRRGKRGPGFLPLPSCTCGPLSRRDHRPQCLRGRALDTLGASAMPA